MKKAKRRLMGLLLAIVVIMGSVPTDIGYVVNATEASSTEDSKDGISNQEDVQDTEETAIPAASESAESSQSEEAEFPQSQEAESLQSEEAESPQSKEAESLQSEEAESPQSKEAESLQSEEAESPQSEEAESPQSEEAESLQSEEAESPQSEEAVSPPSGETAVLQNEETRTAPQSEEPTTETGNPTEEKPAENNGTTLSGNAETSTVEEADAGDEAAAYAYRLNITGQVQAGDVYAISFYHASTGHRHLYLHNQEYQGVDSRADIISGNVSNDTLTLVEDTAFSKARQLWEVVEHDGGLALKSKAGSYYLDLDTEDAARARISTTPVKVKFSCVNAESGLYTIKSEDESKWLSYSNNRYVCMGSGNPQQVNLYKQTAPEETEAPVTDNVEASEWENWVQKLTAKAAMAVSLEADRQTFDGSDYLDASKDAAAVKAVNTGSIILRFKADTNTAAEVILGTRGGGVEISGLESEIGKGASAFFVKEDGRNFRFVYDHTRAELNGPSSFTDGQWHTVVLSSMESGKYMRVTIDGREMWSNTEQHNQGLFSKQASLDEITIGGQRKKDGTLINGFKGSISDVIITSESISDADAIAISKAGYTGTAAAEDENLGSDISRMFNTAYGDSSWVFVGGEAVQGGFSQTGGVRNYIGQFEEYIRWTKGSSTEHGRQRYTINLGKSGSSIAEAAAEFAQIKELEPKAVSYMVGKEDYNKGEADIDRFKENLRSFINQALELQTKEDKGGGFVVIQKPFAVKDTAINTTIRAYCDAVDAVAAEFKNEEGKYSRIVIVDHFGQTDNSSFKADKLQADGKTLNAAGHYEIGAQLAEAVYGSRDGFAGSFITFNRVEESRPSEYLEDMPQVTATDSSLKVVINSSAAAKWKYELDMDGTIVSENNLGNRFTIENLVQGKTYVLKIQSQDGTKQLVTTKGTITNNEKAVKNTQELNDNQKAIKAKVDGDESLTWLFVGDSITHAALWTMGYDGTAQAFEKYVREELGRTDDIVINTGVSGATTKTTLDEIYQRVEKYKPDVISIMLGTNDVATAGITVSAYKENLKAIADAAKKVNNDVIVILRSPTAHWNEARIGKLEPYIAAMKAFAEENGYIYVDQYTEVNDALNTYSWLKSGTDYQKFLFGDSLHPGTNGQRVMNNQLLRAMGLYTEDSPITNLMYTMPIAEDNSDVEPAILQGPNEISVSVSALEEASKLQLGHVTILAKSQTTGQTYEVTVTDDAKTAAIRNLPAKTTYEVTVSGLVKSTAKKVTFAKKTVTLPHDNGAVRSSRSISETAAGAEIVPYEPPSGTTKNQPFLKAETADSENYRIPCIVTLSTGRIVAVADARWNHDLDGRGIDVVASYSDDGGKTWNYTTPMYFNDCIDATTADGDATVILNGATIMDPVMIKGEKDKLYILADMFPGSTAIERAMPQYPESSDGHEMIAGTERLVLYTSNQANQQDDNNYAYYVGDFDDDGMAPVVKKGEDLKAVPSYWMDSKFFLYDADKNPMYCMQIGSSNKAVQQSVFGFNADLHVRVACYLGLIISEDGGQTWSDPVLINQQVDNEDGFYGVGPGTGICLEDGTLMFPMYGVQNAVSFNANQQRSSIIFSTDGGKSWTRTKNSTDAQWTSESVLVQIDETTVRQFLRCGNSKLSYVDFTKEGDEWVSDNKVTVLSETVKDNNQLSAIKLSKTVDGKEVIIVSAATTNTLGTEKNDVRADGRIYTYQINKDKSMTKLAAYDVFDSDFVFPDNVTYSDGRECYTYSSLTEHKDGSIGLLVEVDFKPARMIYHNMTLETACPGVQFDEGKTAEQTETTVIVDDDVTASNQPHYFTYNGNTDFSGKAGWSDDPNHRLSGLSDEGKSQHWVWNQDGTASDFTYTFTFNGTGADIYGIKNDAQNNFKVDGGKVQTVDITGASGQEIVLFRVRDLEYGKHTITVSLPKGQNYTGLQVSYAKVFGAKAVAEQAAFSGSIVDVDTQYTEERYNDLVTMERKDSESLTAWKNDTAISALALFTENCAAEEVSIEVADLIEKGGKAKISKDAVTATFIKSTKAYVGEFLGYGSDRPNADIPAETATNRKESADILYQTTPMDIGKNEVQAVWVEFAIPKTAQAGTYTTTLTVNARDLEEPLVFNYEVTVQNAILADETEFKDGFSIDFWHHPYAAAEYYGVEPFSKEHLAVLQSNMDIYKKAGGNTIFGSMVEEPWNGQTWSNYDTGEKPTYPSMIKWTKDAQGNFSFNYDHFDKWVEFNLKNGLGEKIVMFSISPWHNSFKYYDTSGKLQTQSYQVGSAEYTRIWKIFLEDFAEHLDEKGWFDRTYIGIDERGFSETAFDLIESVTNKDGHTFKIMGYMDKLSDDTLYGLAKRCTEYCIGDYAAEDHSARFASLLKYRDEADLKTTFYSCTEHRPGNFSLSAPVESYFTVINAGKAGATGFSRWAYDAWVPNPLEDATHSSFEPGDCFVIYPDLASNKGNAQAKSSVRLERMAEGVRDMNKIMKMVKEYPQLQEKVDAMYAKIATVAYKDTNNYLTAAQISQLRAEMNCFKEELAALTEEYIKLSQE